MELTNTSPRYIRVFAIPCAFYGIIRCITMVEGVVLRIVLRIVHRVARKAFLQVGFWPRYRAPDVRKYSSWHDKTKQLLLVA